MAPAPSPSHSRRSPCRPHQLPPRRSSQLPSVDVTVRDVPLGSLEDKLRRAARPGVRLLDIAVPEHDLPTTVSSVLREAARMSPAQLRFTVPPDLTISPGDRYGSVDLPRFNRATSIELCAPPHIPITHSRRDITGQVHSPLLESLSLSGCRVDLAALIPQCPRLRELTVVAGTPGDVDFIIQLSFLLQRLVADRDSIPTRRIVVQAPELKQLTMSLNASRELSVSIVAPIVEKVSWRCSYTSVFHGLGFWRLLEVSLEAAVGHGWWAGCCSNAGTGEEDAAGSPLARVNVLSLRLCSSIGYLGFRDQRDRICGGDIETYGYRLLRFGATSHHKGACRPLDRSCGVSLECITLVAH